MEGAYIRWTEDQLFDCADYWDMNEARVKEIIGYCAEVCLFDPVMWKTQCILTSRAIQSRYLDICKISKKKSYIPLEILLVEPEQPMREPVAMPLFEGGAGAAEHDTPNQATLAEQKFRVFGNFPEYSGKFRKHSGKTDKEKKIKEKQRKSSSTPPQPSGALTEEEARVLLSSTVLGEDRSSKTGYRRASTVTGGCEGGCEGGGRETAQSAGADKHAASLQSVAKRAGGGTAALTAWRNRKSCLVYSCRNARKQTSQNAASIPVEATAGCNGTSGRRKPGR